MNALKNYLAIDLGASSGRGIVGSFDGEHLTLRENCRFSNDPVRVCGRLYWDILRIFHEIKNSIRQTAIDGDNIRSIGIDTWGVDYGLLDKAGRLMSNPVHYRDMRTAGIEKHTGNIISLDEIYRITGIQSLSFNTLYQLYAQIRENKEILSEADKMLFIPDLLGYFLTGIPVSEYTVMSTGALLDAQKRAPAWSLLKSLGIPCELLAPLVQPGNRLGGLLPEVLEDVGEVKATVVNVASHDTASAVIAVPTQKEKFIYISSGTWSLMGTELPEPLINSEGCAANYTNEGGAGNTIRYLKNIMGLWILQESRRQWKREGKEYSFALLEEYANAAQPFVSLINPDDKSFAVPGNMPERIAEYCRITGQRVPQSIGETVRCIYESLALKYKMTVKNLIRLTGIEPEEINIVGGGSKDGLLNRMTADACGIPVTAGPSEATAVGNLIIQAISDGELKNIAEGRELITRSFPLKYYEPHETSVWDAVYEKFAALPVITD